MTITECLINIIVVDSLKHRISFFSAPLKKLDSILAMLHWYNMWFVIMHSKRDRANDLVPKMRRLLSTPIQAAD